MSNYMRQVATNIRQSRHGGRVERCHAIPHHGSYSNAAHQWGVAMLMHYLWPEDFSRLALYCLTHDVPEGWVGDIPAPTLRHVDGVALALKHIEGNINRDLDLPGEDELRGEDFIKLKSCDRLELWLWCQDQLALGNQFVQETVRELDIYLDDPESGGLHPLAKRLLLELRGCNELPRQSGVMRSAAERVAS